MERMQEKKADVHVCAGKAAAQPFLDIGPSIESSIMPCLCYKQAFFALIKKLKEDTSMCKCISLCNS